MKDLTVDSARDFDNDKPVHPRGMDAASFDRLILTPERTRESIEVGPRRLEVSTSLEGGGALDARGEQRHPVPAAGAWG
ncbi:hypothetical protein, partial [Azorhizobium caulinodans]|uniref:hypothetical protein n=2 Tax=Azorhizobium caulinodans TaxID=7 RepID=UPI002FBF1003